MTRRQGEMFERPKRRRSKPGTVMFVIDASGGAVATVKLQCLKCKHRTDWIEFPTVTEAKRGLPCPRCNP